jgi:5-methylcytosine-specific restriction protein B
MSSTTLPGLAATIADFSRSSALAEAMAADDDRLQIRAEYPLEEWPGLPLERYALGQGTPSYCRLLEFGTPHLGSISGGSAAKHIMFRHNSGEWRTAAPLRHLDPQAAWARLREEFVSAFALAAEKRFDEIDGLALLAWGPALLTKSLASYFPGEFLPIYSLDHLHYFISLFGAEPPAGQTWTLNRALRALVADCPLLAGWSSDEVMELLYSAYDPRTLKGTTILKVSPGENAIWWPGCRDGGFIAIDAGGLGDLTDYTSDADLQQSLDRLHPENTGSHLAQARALLAYRDLAHGDLVVANRGKSLVLAVGTVTNGYRHDPQRPYGQNLVEVEWDESYAQTINPPWGWQSTIIKVKPRLWATIQAGRCADEPDTQPQPLPEDVARVLAGLERRGQVILFGVPGTGKTRLAFRTALALAGRHSELDDPMRAITALLTDGTKQDAPRLRMVTFHPNYGYEDFIEGLRPRPHQPENTPASSPAPAPTPSGLILDLVPGVFRQLCHDAAAHPAETFLLIIDELNRGDLPRVFGELITVLEADKRGIPVLLASGRHLTVPGNVRIIATMNMADRSIGRLDAAIRRRFACITVAPDPDAVAGSVGPLDLPAFLSTLNQRIIQVLGPDQQLGHSFLIRGEKPVAAEADLHAAFYDEIVPLLEDYAVGRAELIGGILGPLYNAATGTVSQIPASDLPGQLAAEFKTTAPHDEQAGL